MERKFLEDLGLEKEAIDKIMAENGRDIEKYKVLAESRKIEVSNTEEQLKTANAEIEKFKGLDIDGIKAAADEYKEKYKEAERKAKEEKEAIQFEHSLEKALVKSKAKNVKAVKATLDIDSLKESKNLDADIEAAITKSKEENDYLYESDVSNEGEAKPKFTAGGSKKATKDDSNNVGGLKAILEKASIRK